MITLPENLRDPQVAEEQKNTIAMLTFCGSELRRLERTVQLNQNENMELHVYMELQNGWVVCSVLRSCFFFAETCWSFVSY